MKAEDFCAAMCEGLAFNEVPIGYVLRAPFSRPDGDGIAVYIRRLTDGIFQIEDDGLTVAYLEAAGFNLDSDSRFSALAELLAEYSAFYDENEAVLHTAAMPESEVAKASVSFIALMLRVNDLLLLAADRVKSTFRDDLIQLVENQFGQSAIIELETPLNDAMKDYEIDILVRSRDNRNLAIYAATSESRALEALLFAREYRDRGIRNTRAMLVVETSKPRVINQRTYSRVLNSSLLLASMDGDRIAIANKMTENLIN